MHLHASVAQKEIMDNCVVFLYITVINTYLEVKCTVSKCVSVAQKFACQKLHK